MPNFNTHWLVAIQCIGATPTYIKKGCAVYLKAGQDLRDAIRDEINKIVPSGRKDNSKKAFKKLEEEIFGTLCGNYERKLNHRAVRDNVTCFSAYMLGACGPDFWTTVSTSKRGIIPDTAGIHFDLGHYNRSHRQFQVAIKRWKKKSAANKNYTQSLQYKVEVSYFLGMASHIATDLIFHQLVNVYAGAYNLLEKKWESEHGFLSNLKNLWNTHNKVEHFWDSYIRYRYIGDYKALWKGKDDRNILVPLAFPIAEAMAEWVEKKKSFKAKSRLKKWLLKEKTKLKIEKCFIFPRIACDKIVGRKVLPFIYKVVVDKTKGAYPKYLIFSQANTEAKGYQMTDRSGLNECRKLAYFKSSNNRDTNTCSFNYLNYYVCPNLARTKKYGYYVFYHLNALSPFISSADLVSKDFITKLMSAINKKNASDIGSIDHFWNLDTGLGLKVSKVVSDTTKETITELNFIHICDFLKHARITYRGYTTKLKCMKTAKSFDTITYPSPPVRAFKTYAGKKTFNNIDDVYEDDSKKKEYLEKIKLKLRASLESLIKVNTFFKPAKQTSVKHQLAETVKINEKNVIVVADQKHRLTLRLKTAIVPFRKSEKLGFYFLGDKKKGITDSVKYKEGMQKEWLKHAQTKAQTLLHTSTGPNHKLARFKGHFLINLENDKTLKRKLKKGEWNNVVPYQTHQKHYGRNFAISTGRRHVLTPNGDGIFWGDDDFDHFSDVSPTEHIFFSLYLLVRTETGCYDMISKQKVAEKNLNAIKKIDCLGFVKIVLFYVLDKHGASQVDACYVDGLEVPVATITD